MANEMKIEMLRNLFVKKKVAFLTFLFRGNKKGGWAGLADSVIHSVCMYKCSHRRYLYENEFV